MDQEIHPRRILRAQIVVPGDKSISHRVAIFGALAHGTTVVDGFLTSLDCLNTLQALRQLGVPVRQEGSRVWIEGVGLDGFRESPEPIDVGNSGTAIRLLAGLCAGQPFRTTLTGDASIRRRPMDRIVRPLRMMGAQVSGVDGDRYAPLTIRGGSLRAIHYRSPVASAQVKSCVLLAGLYADGPTAVTEPALSRDHTERMLTAFGAKVEREGLTVTVWPRPQLRAQRWTVPGDFSSAAFFLVAGLLMPDAEWVLKGVGINPTRTGLLDALRAMGGRIELENERLVGAEPVADLRVFSSRLVGAEFRGEWIVRMIDEIPVLALAASQAAGETIVRDAQELRVKESDRIATIAETMGRLGVQVETYPDGFRIVGPQPIRSGSCSSFGDHRIAMTAAVAGLLADGPVRIEDVACVETSFPGFWKVLAEL
ncbi:MAG: 3-phosphoshikimate 1-carboxyvinyltransferase [Candidatus Poribacteria bacterium]|nr:MAG: 3-phosphoshikimate 1-carboxyvinyltransferase [Candidatus Poribacteria bacterium]